MTTMTRRRKARKSLSKHQGYGRVFQTLTEQSDLKHKQYVHAYHMWGTFIDYNRIYNEIRISIASMSTYDYGVTLKPCLDREFQEFDSTDSVWEQLMIRVKGCAFYAEKPRSAARLLKLMLYIEHRAAREEGTTVRAMPLDVFDF